MSKGEGNPGLSGVDLGSGDLFSSLEGLDAPPPAEPIDTTPASLETAAPIEAPVAAPDKKAKKEKKPKAPKTPKVKTPGPGLMTRLAQASPYTVMLAVSAASLGIGILILAWELADYGFAFK